MEPGATAEGKPVKHKRATQGFSQPDIIGGFTGYQKRLPSGKATWGGKQFEARGLRGNCHPARDEEAHGQIGQGECDKADEVINQGSAPPEVEKVLSDAIQGSPCRDLGRNISKLIGQAKARARLASEHVPALHGSLGFCGEETLKKSATGLARSKYLSKEELSRAVRYAIAASLGARRYGRRPASNFVKKSEKEQPRRPTLWYAPACLAGSRGPA